MKKIQKKVLLQRIEYDPIYKFMKRQKPKARGKYWVDKNNGRNSRYYCASAFTTFYLSSTEIIFSINFTQPASPFKFKHYFIPKLMSSQQPISDIPNIQKHSALWRRNRHFCWCFGKQKWRFSHQNDCCTLLDIWSHEYRKI